MRAAFGMAIVAGFATAFCLTAGSVRAELSIAGPSPLSVGGVANQANAFEPYGAQRKAPGVSALDAVVEETPSSSGR